MGKTDYILRSLSKISKKRWEHYTINRIYHLLNDPEIEFVCQQCIRKNDRKIYLADLFLPQLNLYLEIDEGHHNSEQSQIDDAIRRLDITEATGFQEERIPASGVTIDALNINIDIFVELVRKRKSEIVANGRFHAWDYDNKYSAERHIAAGSMSVGPHAIFRYHKDALSCFGYSKGHHQSGSWNLPTDVCDAIGLSGKCMVWFPKLYEQKEWNNALSPDGTIITEINKDPHYVYTEKWDRRIVMAHSRDELNRTFYRFLGIFKVIPEFSSGNELRFQRIDTTVKTFSRTIENIPSEVSSDLETTQIRPNI